MSRVGFIGTGHIAAPMVRFLARAGHDVTVSDRNAGIAADLAQSVGATVAPNQSVIDVSDILFLCVRPHVASQVLQGLTFRADQQIVSVMAGVPLDTLRTLCAPACDISLTIPLGYLEQGGCPLPAYPTAEPLKSLFGPQNPVFAVPSESALNQHFAICGVVPGMLDLMATASGWLGQATGDADAAEFYVTQLLSGYLATMPRDQAGQQAAERDSLATDGTLSLQMTDALRAGGVHDTLIKTLAAIGARLDTKS
jgi:pyrroline-5-carboxylate reductase